MEMGTEGFSQPQEALYRQANILALITIFYNILEGVFSVWFGFDDETFSLFGFGLDSFVEVISGMGVWHMLQRIRRAGEGDPDRFERRALQVTGTAFYLLTAGLIITGIMNIIQGHKPETTFWGIIISAISIIAMWALMHYKVKVGKELHSEAILADASCTKTCLYLSIVLLLASVGYELTGIGGIDAAGAIIIAAFSFYEGREAFERAAGQSCSCSECQE